MKELSQQAAYDRRMSQRSLYYLCKEVLGYKDMVPHVHGDLCDFATNPKYSRFRQATVPRSWFKTWVLTIGKSIWLTLPDEEALYKDIYPYKGANVRILIASNVIDNASKMINKIKREWESNDRLKAAFPELVPEFNKTRWSDHCAEVRRGGTYTEGTYTAVGAGGSVISQHFDHIIEDDLIYAKKDDFTGQELMPSQEDIDNAIGWHKLTFSLLANPKEGCIDNVGTRWAPHDIIDYIRRCESQYECLEISVTRDAAWPIFSNEDCVWPERYDINTLETIRGSQGVRIFECFPKEAPILMADWLIKPIGAITVGDEVVGFTKGFGRYKSCLTKATVNLVEKLEKEVVKITLASGKVIRCTADHPWYTGRYDKTHKTYKPARVGASLLRVHNLKEPTPEELLDYRYLAGLIDGEGACSHGSIAIGQSKYANPDVYNSILNVVERLQIPYSINTVNPNESHTLRNKTIVRGLAQSIVLGGGRQIKGDIIRFGKPAKANRILKTIWKNCCGPIKGKDKIVSIEPDGVETVYAIGTTTGNYVAYGYATKNTQYLNRPRAGEDVAFNVAYLIKHDSIQQFPSGLQFRTLVDLASWKDSKKICRNVVLTGAKDDHNNLWVARVDAGKFTPTDVIELIKSHQLQFKSKVLVEEVGYQVALRHFAKIDMQKDGSQAYFIEQLPPDNRKGAKDLRIQSLQPVVVNGMMHILNGMDILVQEMEDYPYGSTKDILDVLGFLLRHAPRSVITEAQHAEHPFSLEAIEREFASRKFAAQGIFANPLAHGGTIIG